MSNDKRQERNETRADGEPERARIPGKLFAMCEISEVDEARSMLAKLDKDDPMRVAILTTTMPLARLVDGDAVCAVRRAVPSFVDDPKMGRRPLPGPLQFTPVHLVADYWDGNKATGTGHVRVAGFLDALGQTILPATIKRTDPKRDQDEFRIAYA